MTGKKRLTDKMLERMQPPKQGRLEMADELCPGLVLRVTQAGAKSFSVIYRVAGEGGISETGWPLAGPQRRITLGRWPAVALADARERARGILTKAEGGSDPRVERAEAVRDRRANTFAAVADRHIEQDAKRTIDSWNKVECCLRLHVVPVLGDRPIVDIKRADVHALLDDLVADGRIGTAREVRKQLSRVFNWAADREIIDSNPIAGMKRADLARNSEAGRSLSDVEMRAIWKAADELRYPFGTLYQALMLTGQRRTEWADSRRSEIDLNNQWLALSRERFKGRREHIIPMSGPVLELFDRLPVWAAAGDYFLYSSHGGRVPVAGFSQGKKRLDETAERILREETGDKSAVLKKYRIHDFRVTCETRLAHLGFNREVRDAVLGHAKPGLQRTYNKHDYMAEKREALEAYGHHVMETVA